MPVDQRAILQRLHATEVHLHAAGQMLEEDRPCQQILGQLNAIQCALGVMASQLLSTEVERCLQEARENPCPELRCKEIANLSNLYPLVSKFQEKYDGDSLR